MLARTKGSAVNGKGGHLGEPRCRREVDLEERENPKRGAAVGQAKHRTDVDAAAHGEKPRSRSSGSWQPGSPGE